MFHVKHVVLKLIIQQHLLVKIDRMNRILGINTDLLLEIFKPVLFKETLFPKLYYTKIKTICVILLKL